MLTLYDADRCPYCARVRIVLAEKGVGYETVVVDLDDRPAWIYEKNPLGKVPVLEEDDFVLPESAVIMEYLEERYPEPPLWPADPAERAAGRLLVERFDPLSRPYYALRRGDEDAASASTSSSPSSTRFSRRRPFLDRPRVRARRRRLPAVDPASRDDARRRPRRPSRARRLGRAARASVRPSSAERALLAAL